MINVGRDNMVAVAARCGMEGPGIEPRQFRPWKTTILLYNWNRDNVPGLKRPGRGVDQPPHLPLKLNKE
jgi:hypothetical protein